jgi:hypothetical protein
MRSLLGKMVSDKALNTNIVSAAGREANSLYVSFGPALPDLAEPRLLTTIDAEESFDWSQPLTRDARDLAAIGQQYLAHEVFSRHAVVPTYLMTYPVVAQEDGYRPMLELLDDGKCEIGTQLHSWVTPPFDEAVNLRNSFPGNLPTALEFEKIRILTDAIAQRFARSPQVYRAGRYGLGPNTYDALRRLGYRIDTSVVPEQDYGSEGGPSFFDMPVSPYWTDADGILLEIPLTSAFVGAIGRTQPRLAQRIYRDEDSYRFLKSVLARGKVLERTRLTPEGMKIGEAKKLVRALRAEGVGLFVISYHAPSLVVGNTPYVNSIAERDELLRWLDEFYEFFASEIGGAPATMGDLFGLAAEQRRRVLKYAT